MKFEDFAVVTVFLGCLALAVLAIVAHIARDIAWIKLAFSVL